MQSEENSQAADVAIVGYGWVGSIIAARLIHEGLNVVVLERGADLLQEPCGHFHGAIRERRPHDRTQNAALETFTLRYTPQMNAVPIRRMGPFLSGSGVGGGGVLWGGVSPRYKPKSFKPRQHFAHLLDTADFDGIEMRDWPINYDDLESGYAAFELLAGVSGPTDPVDGAGWRSTPYPLQPARSNEGSEIFRLGASSLGLNVVELPVTEIDQSYTNPYGVRRTPCEQYGTTLATPLNTLDPFNRASGKLTLITGAQVRRVEHAGREVTGIRYVKDGEERSVSARAYVLAAWTLNNVRLLLLSKVGEAYDPRSGRGMVGRGLSNHMTYGAAGFFRSRTIDSSLRTGAGWVVSDFENGLCDADGLAQQYVGGVQMHSSNLELKPKPDVIAPPGVPRWGHEWKEAMRDYANGTIRINFTGEVVSHRDRYVDLDNTYRDAWGDPLLRLTYDWKTNERKQIRAMAAVGKAVLRATGADSLKVTESLSDHYNLAAYQNSHVAGGAIMGTHPSNSVVDSELRCWDMENLWVVGASSFPRNAAANPTPTVAALAMRAAGSIIASIRGSSLRA
ncbi:GMC family oxidoreductase [Caballeronia sp. dw_19]|uniref:GMC oxidoreductase n=1 Tax=Caballeronia sp. dw_19 TaxID=2719791 RepID=UPI001BD60AED|nr:GMC family oxidoreductase [Caballeronia sp. dw_19]